MLFIPHMALHNVPWALLPLPGANPTTPVQMLLQRFAPATAPSLRVALRCSQRFRQLFSGSNGELPAARCCIVGNPLISGEYPGKPAPLTGAGREAASVGELLFGISNARRHVLLGEKATAATVANKMENALLVMLLHTTHDRCSITSIACTREVELTEQLPCIKRSPFFSLLLPAITLPAQHHKMFADLPRFGRFLYCHSTCRCTWQRMARWTRSIRAVPSSWHQQQGKKGLAC